MQKNAPPSQTIGPRRRRQGGVCARQKVVYRGARRNTLAIDRNASDEQEQQKLQRPLRHGEDVSRQPRPRTGLV